MNRRSHASRVGANPRGKLPPCCQPPHPSLHHLHALSSLAPIMPIIPIGLSSYHNHACVSALHQFLYGSGRDGERGGGEKTPCGVSNTSWHYCVARALLANSCTTRFFHTTSDVCLSVCLSVRLCV